MVGVSSSFVSVLLPPPICGVTYIIYRLQILHIFA